MTVQPCHEALGALLCRPKVQEIPSDLTAAETCLPICRSSAGRPGTSVNSRDFSTTAYLPLASSTERRSVPFNALVQKSTVTSPIGRDGTLKFGTSNMPEVRQRSRQS